MKRIMKNVAALFLTGAMLFTSVDTGLLAATTEAAGAETAVTAIAEGESPELTADMGAAEPAAEAPDISEAGEASEVAAAALSEEGEEELAESAKLFIQTDGTTYMQAGESTLGLGGDISGSYNTEQISAISLETESGSRVALNSYYSCYTNYGGGTSVNADFRLYQPIQPGTYFAKVKTTDGKVQTFSKLIVVDQPTAGQAWVPSEYDNTGDYLHLQVQGILVGDGTELKPVLKYEGKTAAEYVGLVAEYNSTYIFKMKKNPDLNWKNSMGLTVEYAPGVTNLSDSVEWYPDGSLIEHAYYEVYKKKTQFQLKKDPRLTAGTLVTVQLRQDGNGDIVASGTGKVDGDGLLSLDLKDASGNTFIPVDGSYVGTSRSYTASLTIGDEEVESWLQIYRYDYGYNTPSTSYCWIVRPSEMVYTTDTSFQPVLSISKDRLTESGDLTVEIEGNTGKLSASGSYFSGTVSLVRGLSEGYHAMTVRKGSKEIGTVSVYSLEKDVFYQDSQWEDHGVRNGKSCLIASIASYSLGKEYYQNKYLDGAAAKKIWEQEKLKLQVFTPDGKELSPNILDYRFGYSTFTVYFEVPKEAENYYGLYIRFTSDGNLGRYIYSDSKQSYYGYNGTNNYYGEQYTEEYGEFRDFGFSGFEFHCTISSDSKTGIGEAKYDRLYASGVSFPLTVTITKKNETEAITSFTIPSSKMNGTEYYFTKNDVKGLDPKEPYELHVSDGVLYADSTTGYVSAYTGKIPTPSKVAVKTVTINETAPKVAVGASTKLTTTVEPSDATYDKITWKSSSTKIATVDENGVVTGVAPGTVKITATAGGKSGTVEVEVIEKVVPLEAFALEKTAVSVGLGETVLNKITVTPADATEQLTFTPENSDIALVTLAKEEGKTIGCNVRGMKAGSTTVKVTGGSLPEQTFTVTVNADLQSVKLSKTTLSMGTGQRQVLTAETTPEDTGLLYRYEWTAKLPEGMTGMAEDYVTLTPSEDGGKSVQILAKKAVKDLTLTVTATDPAAPAEGKSVTASAKLTITASDLTNDDDPTVSGNEYEKKAEALEKAAREEATSGKGLWIDGLEKEYKENGIGVEPDVTVYYESTRLHLGKDYTISFKNNKTVGNAELTVTGKGNYTGKLTQSFKIVASMVSAEAVSLKGAKIDKIPDQLFTGSPIEPAISVTLKGGSKLDPAKEAGLLVSYSKNTDAGTATVFVTGDGTAYKDAVKATFKIKAVSMDDSGIAVDCEESAPYMPGGAKAAVSVTYTKDGKTWGLREGTDYKLSWGNNKALGTASVTVTGMGNFTKKAVKEFTVAAADLSETIIAAPDVLFKQAGKAGTSYQSKIKVYDKDGKALSAGKDYTAIYTDLNTGAVLGKEKLTDIAAGHIIEVTLAPGNKKTYEGENSATYYLRATSGEVKDLGKAKAEKIPQQTFTGDEIELDDSVALLKDLKRGEDYEVIGYVNNVLKGTATAILQGEGSCSGVKLVTFKIGAAKTTTDTYLGFWNSENGGFDTTGAE